MGARVLVEIGKLLTKDKSLFVKYRLESNPTLGISLLLKVVFNEISFWCSIDQVIFKDSAIDFQSLVLVKNGLFFPRTLTRVDATAKANAFLNKFKLFCVENNITIGPTNFNKIQPGNLDKFPVNLSTLEKWVPS